MPMKPEVHLHRARPTHPPESVRTLVRPRAEEVCVATIILRPKSPVSARRVALREMELQLPGARRYWNAGVYAARFGSAPEEIAAVRDYVESHGLSVLDVYPNSLVVSGPLNSFRKAFDVRFVNYSHPSGDYRSHEGPVKVPRKLAAMFEAVVGLDNRALAEHHAAFLHRAAATPVEPAAVIKAYEFPSSTGKGQTIGIIELDGGFHASDIRDYFKAQGVTAPKIRVVELGGAKNRPAPKALIRKYWKAVEKALSSGKPPVFPLTGSAGDDLWVRWTIEVTMDIQLAAMAAPGVDLVVYFAQNNSQGKHLAINTAITDTVSDPSVLSLSWGTEETNLTPPETSAFQKLFESAALRGITICCSSGDDGDGTFNPDGSPNGQKPSVHFPSSSPHALACGGTHLDLKAGGTSVEDVWNENMLNFRMASTGGASIRFAAPSWQKAAGIPAITGGSGRGIPDVASKADLATGFLMRVGGLDIPMGGTSAAAPFWAGLIARINESLGKRVGLLSSLLYTPMPGKVTRDVTKGNNGPNYSARSGWDACTGWGSPNGTALLKALKTP